MAGTRLARKSVNAELALTPLAATRAGLVATVLPITFEPGLYCIEISPPKGPMTELGIVLPCIRMEFLPATAARQGQGALLNMKEGGWLWGSDVPAFVMVAGGTAGALMTSYYLNDGSPCPSVRITNVPSSLAPAFVPGHGALDAKPHEISLSMVAHITGAGDVNAAADGWLGIAGRAIEGFCFMPVPPFDATDVEYQAILGNDWSTPWVHGGIFCGSRGLQLPIFGFRIRLGRARADYECKYSGRFANGAISGPHHDGEPCLVAETALEAMHVVICRRLQSAVAG